MPHLHVHLHWVEPGELPWPLVSRHERLSGEYDSVLAATEEAAATARVMADAFPHTEVDRRDGGCSYCKARGTVIGATVGGWAVIHSRDNRTLGGAHVSYCGVRHT